MCKSIHNPTVLTWVRWRISVFHRYIKQFSISDYRLLPWRTGFTKNCNVVLGSSCSSDYCRSRAAVRLRRGEHAVGLMKIKVASVLLAWNKHFLCCSSRYTAKNFLVGQSLFLRTAVLLSQWLKEKNDVLQKIYSGVKFRNRCPDSHTSILGKKKSQIIAWHKRQLNPIFIFF